MIRKCLNCSISLQSRHKIKYCSVKCQQKFQGKVFIQRWKSGFVSGKIGINTFALSGHIRRYLLSKYNNSCSFCGWNKIHPITKVVPLEVDHIDGNSDNNSEDNLRLICPNCHALTPHFRNLNRGNGRKWRLNK